MRTKGLILGLVALAGVLLLARKQTPARRLQRRRKPPIRRRPTLKTSQSRELVGASAR